MTLIQGDLSPRVPPLFSPEPEDSKTRALARASLWCGLGGILIVGAAVRYFPPIALVGFPLPVVALVFGFVALGRTGRLNRPPRTRRAATFGIVFGFMSGAPLMLYIGIFLFAAVSACGGQCSSPYLLDVDFHAGTSTVVASTVLHHCGHDPIVTSVGSVRMIGDDILEGQLRVQYFGGVKFLPLRACLYSAPSVQSVGYPD